MVVFGFMPRFAVFALLTLPIIAGTDDWPGWRGPLSEVRLDKFPCELDHRGHVAQVNLLPPGVSRGGSPAGGSAGGLGNSGSDQFDREATRLGTAPPKALGNGRTGRGTAFGRPGPRLADAPGHGVDALWRLKAWQIRACGRSGRSRSKTEL